MGVGMKVVIGGFDLDPVLTASGVISDLDGGPGIYGEAQHAQIGIRARIDFAQLLEDSVGLGNLFLAGSS